MTRRDVREVWGVRIELEHRETWGGGYRSVLSHEQPILGRVFRVTHGETPSAFSKSEDVPRPRIWYVDATDIARALEAAENARMPFLSFCPPCLDGHATTLKISSGMSSLVYRWQMGLPKEWKGLLRLLDLMTRPPRGPEAYEWLYGGLSPRPVLPDQARILQADAEKERRLSDLRSQIRRGIANAEK